MTDQPKMKDSLTALEKATLDMAAIIATLNPDDIPTLARAFKALYECRQQHEAISKIIDTNYRKLADEVLPQAFKNAEIDSIKLAGRNFYLTTRTNASIPEIKQAEGFKWLREVAKCPELIAERVNAKQLSSVVARHFEEFGELPPEDAVTVHFQETIAMRKS